jgi:hypothetical protein
MDCEKFEAVMLDELYDELDELTSAAAKRHLAGCARCAALFSGLRATRRVAVVPRVEPPSDLEDRILAAARSAQASVPLKRRVGRAISWAGNWAMRPQTAMAAVFLLMIGSSLLFLRGKSRSPASAMHVTEEGAPAPAACAAPEHAADEALPTAAAPEWKKGASSTGTTATLAADDFKDAPRRRDSKESFAREKAEEGFALDTSSNAGLPAGAPPPPAAQAAPAKPVANSDLESLGGGAPGGPFLPADKAATGRTAGGRGGSAGAGDGVLQGQGDPFGSAMGAYQRGSYDEALQGFDRLGGGDVNAALWAARSARNGSPKCGGAVSRFDEVARRAPGTITGWDALLEGGQCYRLIGQPDAARTRLTQLLTVSSHAERARRELQFLSGGGTPAAAKAAAPQATQAPATEKP